VDVAEFWQHDISNKLFADFVITFLKEKIKKKSGWGRLKTDEEQDQFLLDLKNKGGIELQKEEIGFNRTMRFISKIITNCLYGKRFRTVPLFNRIKRTKKLDIVSENQLKTFQFTSVKRSVEPDFNTYPIGYGGRKNCNYNGKTNIPVSIFCNKNPTRSSYYFSFITLLRDYILPE
jgi:hypothetical protein